VAREGEGGRSWVGMKREKEKKRRKLKKKGL